MIIVSALFMEGDSASMWRLFETLDERGGMPPYCAPVGRLV